MIQPEGRPFVGDIISTLERNKMMIKNVKMLKMSALNVVQFLNQRDNISILENLTSGKVVAMEIIGENVFDQLKLICGPKDFDEAKNHHPHSLRALYGFDSIRNAIMLSDDVALNQQDLEFFFPRMNDNLKVQAKFHRSTLCIIKPHAIKENLIGGILKMITENGFSISAMKMMQLTRSQCETFCEVYKGVVDNFVSMITQLHSGICLALEVQGDDEDVQTKFRALCGPADVSIAKQIRPRTIRAVFGTDKTLNAVHCTDLKEDTLLELEFIFKVL
jgi:nucleoside-diphosphate kinase